LFVRAAVANPVGNSSHDGGPLHPLRHPLLAGRAGWFERVGGPLVEDGNPPAGWSNPSQPGRVTLADDLATFTDDAGHKESFKKLDKPPSSATNCA
jgi:hypothetical protein